MSTDEERERAATCAAAAITGVTIARQHLGHVEYVLAGVTQYIGGDSPPRDSFAAFWAAYLGQMLGAMRASIGEDATALILRDAVGSSPPEGHDRAH